MDLVTWLEGNTVGDQKLWKGSSALQSKYLLLMLDRLKLWDKDALAEVVSVHYSKSIELPVVKFTLPAFELSFVCRNNFYNWGFTLVAGCPLDQFNHDGFGFGGHSVYYEGFDRGGIPVHTHTPVAMQHAEFSFKLLGLEPLEALPRLIRAVRDGRYRKVREARDAEDALDNAKRASHSI